MLGARVILWSFLSVTIACPPDTYGPSCAPCPGHTTCPSGGSTAHDCRCQSGFVCLYYKQLRAVVTLNTSLTAFQSNANGVRSAFISGIAASAGVVPEQVSIADVVPRSFRRLLANHESIDVDVLVTGARALSRVHEHLTGIHLDHSWTLVPRVLVFPASPPQRVMGIAIEQNTSFHMGFKPDLSTG